MGSEDAIEQMVDTKMIKHMKGDPDVLPNPPFYAEEHPPLVGNLLSHYGFPSPHHQLMHFMAGALTVSATTPIGFVANLRLVDKRRIFWTRPHGYTVREYFTSHTRQAAFNFGATMWLVQSIKAKLEYVDDNRHDAADGLGALRSHTPAWKTGGMAGTLVGAASSTVQVAGQRKLAGLSHLPMTAHSYLSIASFSSRWGTTFAVYEGMKSAWMNKNDEVMLPFWRRWLMAAGAAGAGQFVALSMLDFGTFLGWTPKPIPKSELLKKPEPKLQVGENSQKTPPKQMVFKIQDMSSMSQEDFVKQLMGKATETKKDVFKVKDVSPMSQEDIIKQVMAQLTGNNHQESSAGMSGNSTQRERATTTPKKPPQPEPASFPSRFTLPWWRIVMRTTIKHSVILGTGLALQDVLYKGLVRRASGKDYDDEM